MEGDNIQNKSKNNRWQPEPYIIKEYTRKVKKYLGMIEKIISNNGEIEDEFLEVDYSDTKLNPHSLGIILESLGYELVDSDSSGWQLDYSMVYVRKEPLGNIVDALEITGTAILFELILKIIGA